MDKFLVFTSLYSYERGSWSKSFERCYVAMFICSSLFKFKRLQGKSLPKLWKQRPSALGIYVFTRQIFFVFGTELQSWTLIIMHMRNVVNNCFSANLPTHCYFRSASSGRDNKWFFVSGLGTRFLLALLLVSSEWPYDLRS